MSFSGTKGYITKPKPGVMLNPLHPLSRGLVGYWLFNEGSGSLANDISGHGNYGTLKNMSPNVQGSGWGGSKFGGGLEFDGTNDHVDCGNDESFNTEEITVTFWVKLSSVIVSHDVMSKEWANSPSNSDSTWVWQILPTEIPEFYIINSSGTGTQCSMGTAISGDIWYYLTSTYDKSNIKVYLNGVLKNTVPYTQDMVSSTDKLWINGQKWNGVYYRRFNGSIDGVSIYNRALLAAEIKQLYHNPFCNLLQVPFRRYSVAAPLVGAIMNQFQTYNLGADLYNGTIIA